MEQKDKDILVEAVSLIKKGENETAVKILTELLGRLPQLDNGWFLLGLALDTPKKKRFAFERALKINPGNDRAKMQLLRLEDDLLPKVPKQIVIEGPPEPPPPKIEAPVISTPWNDFETADGEAVELPSWAKEMPSSSQKSSSDATIRSTSSSWEWEDEIPDEEPTPQVVVHAKTAAETTEVEEEEEGRKGRKKKNKRDKRKKKTEDEEPNKKRKRRSSKDQKLVEDRSEETEPSEEPEEDSLQDQLRGGKPFRRRKRRVRISRRAVFLLFLIFLCGGLGGAAYYYQNLWVPLAETYLPTALSYLTQEPTPTSAATRTPTSTPASQPTLPPTWTPTFVENAPQFIPTLPTYETPPTITPTPLPLDSTTNAEMDTIQQQIQTIREINDPLSVDRELIPAVKFKDYMQSLEISRYDPEKAAKQAIVLQAFGFVAHDYYTIEAMMNDAAGFFSGYYYPEQRKIYIPGTSFSDQEKFIYSFEYSLALLENNFDVADEFCQTTVDTCLAQTALVVGDAVLTQDFWQETYSTDFNPQSVYNLENPAPVFQDYWTPPYFDAFRNFPIRYGGAFAKHLYQDNGWQTLNYTYRFSPETSEQIMHLNKYDERERPVLLYDPDLIPILGAGWNLVEQGSLGEWRSYLLLSAPDYPDAVRPENEASIAAAGWGGDTYRVYNNPDTGGVAMSIHWNWDTSADRGEFFDSLETSLAGRFQNSTYEGPEGSVCWSLDGVYSCLLQNTKDVLWLYTTDPSYLEPILAVFGQFP